MWRKRWQAAPRSFNTPADGHGRRGAERGATMVQMGTVWDRTTAFVAQAMAAILPIAILLIFLPVSVQIALQPIIVKATIGTRIELLAAFWAIELLGTLAIIVLALGATNRPGEACRAALARWLPTIGIFAVLAIIAGVLAAPMGLGAHASGIDFAALQTDPDAAAASGLSPGLALFLLLYGLAYIVVMMWATARLLVIEPVVLAERRGIGAIVRAVALTRKLTWRIIGVLLLYAIVSTIAVLAAQTVFGSVLRLIAPDDGDIGIASVITAIVVGAISTGFKVLAAVFVAMLYRAVSDLHLAAVDRVEGLAEPS
ncbi:hypothetical protein EAH79_13165 [Sphingomonas koreensis]|nr:hypothetical protein EAH79_13165 [Sphingomonas koreensis]